MRDRASRVLGYAVLASLLLHALVFYVLPAAREMAALLPSEREPLIARVEHLDPPAPAPVPAPAAVRAVRKPAPPDPVPVATPAPAPLLTPPPTPTPAVQLPAPTPAPTAPAPAPVAALQAPPTSAPPPAVDPRLRSDYARRIHEEAERYKVYPRVAIDNNWQGEIGLVMAIAGDGRMASLRVVRSSGHKVLDDQALEMFQRAKPRVRVPAALRGRAFELELRAVFRLEG